MKLSFGTGATNINLKIQKKLGTNFIGIEYHYFIFNIYFFKLLLTKLKLIGTPDPDKYSFPDKLKSNYKFIKISNVTELNIPNNGYWSDPSIKIDFVRDEHFLRNRFFENFLKYHFYKLEHDGGSELDECYFVVRPVIESGFPVLAVVDFRFDSTKPKQFKFILKAAAMLAKRNRIPLLTVRTSIKLNKLNLYPLIYRTGSKQHLSAPLTIKTDPRLLVTSADSDTDFIAL
jgi:hypothetical protein